MANSASMPWFLSLLAAILKPLIGLITSKFRDELTQWIQKKYAEALETPNPWDDYFFSFLAKAMGIDLPG